MSDESKELFSELTPEELEALSGGGDPVVILPDQDDVAIGGSGGSGGVVGGDGGDGFQYKP